MESQSSSTTEAASEKYWYMIHAIRESEAVEIIYPWLFDNTIPLETAKKNVMWWLSSEHPKDIFNHHLIVGRKYEARVIGQSMKYKEATPESGEPEKLREIKDVWYFEGMCRK